MDEPAAASSAGGIGGCFAMTFAFCMKEILPPYPPENQISSHLTTNPRRKQRLKRQVRDDGDLIPFAWKLAGTQRGSDEEQEQGAQSPS